MWGGVSYISYRKEADAREAIDPIDTYSYL